MTGQELVVLLVGLLAVGYVLVRFVLRRRAGTCCGERSCPAVKLPPPPDDVAPPSAS